MNSGVVDSREILEFIRNIVEDSSIDDESLEICNRTIDLALKRIDEYGLLKTQLEIAEQTIKLNEWVSIDDRLPEEEKFVLVTTNNGASKQIAIGCVSMSRDDNDVLYGEWFDKLFCVIDDVVAWKPLPEPYSEGKAFIKNVAEPFSKGTQDGMKRNPLVVNVKGEETEGGVVFTGELTAEGEDFFKELEQQQRKEKE